jgi:hypothetical protein
MKKPGLPIVLALGLGWQGQAGLWGQNAAARFISREVKPEVRAEGGAILSRPVALVCDEERLDILGGKLYVADSANRRVQVLDMKGKYLSGFRVPFQPHRVLALAPDRIVVMSLPTGRDGREKVLHGYDGAGQPLWEAVDSFFSGDSVYDLMRNRWFMLKAGGGEFFIARATDDRAVRRLDKDGTLLAEVEISEQNPFQDIEIPVREGKKRPLRALFWNCAADKERLYLLIPERTEDGDLGPGRKVVRVGPSGEVAAEIDLPEKLSRIAVEGKTIFGTDLDARLRVFVMVPR